MCTRALIELWVSYTQDGEGDISIKFGVFLQASVLGLWAVGDERTDK